MASTWRIGGAVPCAACRSWNTWFEKNLTTSTWALIDVTLCYHHDMREPSATDGHEERLTCDVDASVAMAPNKYTAESLAAQYGLGIPVIRLQPRLNPCPDDLCGLCPIATPDEGLQHISGGLSPCAHFAAETADASTRREGEIETVEFEEEGDVGYDDALDERGDDTARGKKQLIPRTNRRLDELWMG